MVACREENQMKLWIKMQRKNYHTQKSCRKRVRIWEQTDFTVKRGSGWVQEQEERAGDRWSQEGDKHNEAELQKAVKERSSNPTQQKTGSAQERYRHPKV